MSRNLRALNAASRGIRFAAPACALVALAAGCATTAPPMANTAMTYGADRIADNHVHVAPPATPLSPPVGALAARGEESISVLYAGVDGARLAHARFGRLEAERLDGDCLEPSTKIQARETLYDIADYCDVDVELLLAHNPHILDPRFVSDGQTVNLVPSVRRGGIADAASAGPVYVWYTVQAGDSLERIAASHRSTPAEIARINPKIDWSSGVSGGESVLIPAAPASAPAAVSTPSPATLSSAAEAAAIAPGEADAFVPSPEVSAVMPFAYRPRQIGLEGGNGRGLLTVDRRSVNPGGAVTVSGDRLPPNKTVTIYSGPNGREMRPVGSARTDGEGRFSEEVRVSRWRSDLGGVIFKATVDETGQDLQSPRVGVNTLGGDASSAYLWGDETE